MGAKLEDESTGSVATSGFLSTCERSQSDFVPFQSSVIGVEALIQGLFAAVAFFFDMRFEVLTRPPWTDISSSIQHPFISVPTATSSTLVGLQTFSVCYSSEGSDSNIVDAGFGHGR